MSSATKKARGNLADPLKDSLRLAFEAGFNARCHSSSLPEQLRLFEEKVINRLPELPRFPPRSAIAQPARKGKSKNA